jgi:hypothetical protein
MKHVLGSLIAVMTAFVTVFTFTIPAQALSSGPWNIIETYGAYSVYSNDVLNATKVIEASNGRNMTWVDSLSSYNGDETGYWQFYNGNLMAATNDCSGVVIKNSITDNGVVWALHPASGSNVNAYIINRRCDQSDAYTGSSTAGLTGHNDNGRQFTICGLPYNCSGLYRVFHFSS